MIDAVCDCGNNFQVMELNISRVSDNFFLPNGRIVHGEFFTHLMYGSKGIANFQFHQTAPNAITLWIVPLGGSQDRNEAIQRAVQQIKALVPDEIHVEVRETDSIPCSATGKHRFTRSDVSQSLSLQSQ